MPDGSFLSILALGLLRGAERDEGSGNVAERVASGGYAVAGADEARLSELLVPTRLKVPLISSVLNISLN